MNDLRNLAEAATPGPYFVALDEATECEPHRNSGLSLVDTGRAGDWPIARLCETQSANWIAATDPQTILTLLDRVESSERRAEYWKAEHNAGNAVIEGVDTDAVSALRNVTEELVLAGFPGGDRVAMFASLRELVAERDRLHTEFVRECDDADKICRALNLPGSWRTDGGSLHLPRILGAIAALRAENERQAREIAVVMDEIDKLRDVLTFGAEHGIAWYEAVRALAAERDALRAELHNAKVDRNTYDAAHKRQAAATLEQFARAERAEAECEKLRADAERYQWLRDQMTHDHSGPNVGWTLGVLLPGDDPDAAIDAEREGK